MKKGYIVALAAVICVAVVSFFMFGKGGDGLAPAQKISLVALQNLYRENKVQADLDYRGKKVEFTAEFGRIDIARKGDPIGVDGNLQPIRAEKDLYVLQLQFRYGRPKYFSGDNEYRVYCYFDKADAQALTKLHENQDVTVQGIFDGEESAYMHVPFKFVNCKVIASYRHVTEKDTVATLQKEADENGNPQAMYYLACKYYKPDKHSNLKKDLPTAFKYFKSAADRGHDMAANEAGIMYLIGEGTKTDAKKALEYFKKAAELGESSAMTNIGYMHLNGNGMPKNAEEAAVWFQKAANAGNTVAQKELKKLGK